MIISLSVICSDDQKKDPKNYVYGLTTGINGTPIQQFFSPELAEVMREMEIAERALHERMIPAQAAERLAAQRIAEQKAAELAAQSATRSTKPAEKSFGFEKGFFDKKPNK